MARDLRLRLLLAGAGALAIPAGFIGWRPIEVTLDSPSPPTAAGRSPDAPVSLDTLGIAIIEHDLFRMVRSPAEVAFQPVALEPAHVDPLPPKPQLLLTGLVWGEEPSALLEGLPGVEGVRVMQAGDSSGPIRVKRITRTDVILVGMDTTWVLQIRKPWP